ncbi:MAG: isochorismate synthase [Deltaproteobacteria bacterium]|nr:isochorismate synthase [Deltaproteobacteria bacterium]
MRAGFDALRAEPQRPSHALDALGSALCRGGAHDLAAVLPAPVAPPELLLGFDSASPCTVWIDGESSWTTLGAARAVALRGSMTPADRADVARMADAIAVEDLSGSFVHSIRLVGGTAFDPARAHDRPWEHHGAGRFVLSRWSYVRDADRAWLVVLAGADTRGDAARRGQLMAATARLLDFLADPPRRTSARSQLTDLDDDTDDRWLALVGAAREAVAAGRARKIVAARARHLRSDAESDPTRVVRELAKAQPKCVIYAFRFGGATFVGATPETLVERVGRRVRSEALAGSAPAGDVQQLLASAKDRHEHACVVGDVAARLAASCERVTCPTTPGVRALRDVAHLHTPIEGVLRRDTHVLDLVRALHPTPAVAGTPCDVALRWIAAEERSTRGWYAGPVGWCDTNGDGRFVVALRAAMLRGRDVWTFAGAGIVEGSEPERELQEVRWKERAILRALGSAP